MLSYPLDTFGGMDGRPETCVVGEPVEVLARALMQFKWRKRSDGMAHASARLEPELGNPLFRALMRVEAELLLQDADAIGTDADERRTPDQRRADALYELVRRMSAATVG